MQLRKWSCEEQRLCEVNGDIRQQLQSKHSCTMHEEDVPIIKQGMGWAIVVGEPVCDMFFKRRSHASHNNKPAQQKPDQASTFTTSHSHPSHYDTPESAKACTLWWFPEKVITGDLLRRERGGVCPTSEGVRVGVTAHQHSSLAHRFGR